MKITTENFRAAFDLVARAAAASTTIDILRCARLKADAGVLTMACNDLTIHAEARADCSSGAMDCCVRADLLAAALHTAGDSIDLTLKGEMLIWKSGRARYQMATRESADFPIGKADGEPRVTLEAAEIVEGLKRVALACATTSFRPALSAVLIECVKGASATLVATDQARILALGLDVVAEGDGQFLIHRTSVNKLADGAVRVRLYSERAEFDYANGFIRAQLIEEQYPDWRRGTQKQGKPDAQITVNRKELTAAIKAALPFDEAGSVRFAVADGAVAIGSEEKTGGRADVQIDADADGKTESWFYSAALSPTLQATRGEKFVMTFLNRNVYFEDGPLRCVCAGMRR